MRTPSHPAAHASALAPYQRRTSRRDIDDLDLRIIESLLVDARRSYADIGAQVALSAPAVKRRVDRLRALGVILGYTAVIAPAERAKATEAFVELSCATRAPSQILTAAQGHAEVVAAYTISGAADVLVHLRADSTARMREALARLRADPLVTAARSMIVLTSLADAADF